MKGISKQCRDEKGGGFGVNRVVGVCRCEWTAVLCPSVWSGPHNLPAFGWLAGEADHAAYDDKPTNTPYAAERRNDAALMMVPGSSDRHTF